MAKKFLVYALWLGFIWLVNPLPTAAQDSLCPPQIVDKQVIYLDKTERSFTEGPINGRIIKWADGRADLICSNPNDWYLGSICNPYPDQDSVIELLRGRRKELQSRSYTVERNPEDGTWPPILSFNQAINYEGSGVTVSAFILPEPDLSDSENPTPSHGATGALLPPPTLYALLALLAVGLSLAGGLFLWRSKHWPRS